ncbi:hypothetical protein PQX77_007229 [Marasmius sp. AFHP31]|nr:hypothetical protein PQX77_007229 [Marasmius sp. AFHP31]
MSESNPEEQAQQRRHDAAVIIQRAWKSKNNRAQEKFLSSGIRWKDAAVHAKMKVKQLDRNAADEGKNHPRERWNRAVFFVSQLRNGNAMLKDSGVESKNYVQKHLETQHWLELVDGYLSPEQRLNYLVDIDQEGKLRWARNNELVDTTPGHWKDSGDGSGIVPEDSSEQPRTPPEPRGSFESVSSVSSSSVDSNAAMHYVDESKGKHAWTRAFRRYFTVRGMLNRLLRKTVRRNTWIWVTDRNYNLFIGIKDTGSFQHSSFLAGGLVTSAGLISVKNGMVHTLSPLSGHYRTSTGHFHQFLDKMTERGLNMQKAKISKAEFALWGIEHIGKWKKKQAEVSRKGKEKAVTAGENMAMKLPLVNDSWKKEILEGRKKAEASNENKEREGPSEDGLNKSAAKRPEGANEETPKQSDS